MATTTVEKADRLVWAKLHYEQDKENRVVIGELKKFEIKQSCF